MAKQHCLAAALCHALEIPIESLFRVCYAEVHPSIYSAICFIVDVVNDT